VRGLITFNQTDDQILEMIFQKTTKVCPKCNHEKFYKVNNRKCYECGKCSNQIYPLKGTIMESTKLPLKYWMVVINEFYLTRNGVSAKEIQRRLNVTYKVAWNITSKVRSQMKNVDTEQLSGTIEIDEAYIGGKKRHYHAHPFVNKSTVLGMLERNGRVRLFVIKNRNKETMIPLIRKHVTKGSTIYTDEHGAYSCLSEEGYVHDSIQHNKYQWSKGNVSTNSIEGFWSKLKRSIRGTYIHVSKEKLQSYLDEFAFRHNRRHEPERILDDIINVIINSSISRTIEK
jgi:transposase